MLRRRTGDIFLGTLLGALLAGFLAGRGGAGAATSLPGSPWPKPLGGPDREYGQGLAADEQGNLYTAGRFEGVSAFDAVRLTSAGQTDVFVARLDTAAHVTWAVAVGGAGADEGRAIAVAPAGDVYVTGTFTGTADFDPGPGRTELTSAGGTDAFLLRLSAKGDLVWARRFGGKLADAGLRVAAGRDAVWVTGSFQGTLDAPAPLAGTASAGGSDAFLLAIGLDGVPLWARRIGGAKDDEGRGVAAGRNGEVWVAGSFAEAPSLGPDIGPLDFRSAGHADVFLLHFDAAGKLLWSGRLGGTGDDVCEGLAATVAGGAAVVGTFHGTADLDPGPNPLSVASHGGSDAFLARVDGTGRLLWAHGFGETGDDLGLAVTGDRFGSVYATGFLARRHNDSMGWVAEYSDSGERAWSVGLQATGGLEALAVAVDGAGYTAVAGAFKGETKELREAGSPRVQGAGKMDAFVWRLVPMAVQRKK